MQIEFKRKLLWRLPTKTVAVKHSYISPTSCQRALLGMVFCRRTDKQSATVRMEDEEDGDLTDVALDETLMLNQEPSPEYDLDDEQRPRVSRVCQSFLASTGLCSGVAATNASVAMSVGGSICVMPFTSPVSKLMYG